MFQILHVLRRVDPALAESLISSDEQLAAAVRRFPNGIETLREEIERRVRAQGATCGGGHIMIGRPGDFPYMEALTKASQDGEFGVAMEEALEAYAHDTDPAQPNHAAREFWPSTCRFRGVLYRIGKRLGRDGAAYLNRIPDADLRLFAETEFEAAAAGLPELQGIQRYRPRRS